MDDLTRNYFIQANDEGKLDMFEEAFDNMVEFATSATDKRTTIATLAAHNECMQADAVNNTATIKMLMAQLAEVNEENRGMRQMLHMEPK